MTDYEPYVDDPREPAPRQRLERRRLRVGVLAAVVAAAAIAWLLFTGAGDEDPALEVPVDDLQGEPTDAPATGAPDEAS